MDEEFGYSTYDAGSASVDDDQQQELADQDRHQRISDGSYVLSPQAMTALAQAEDHHVAIETSPMLTNEQKRQARQQVFARETALRRLARPMRPELIPNQPATKIRRLVDSLPLNLRERLGPFIVPGGENAPQFMRGTPGGVLEPEQNDAKVPENPLQQESQQPQQAPHNAPLVGTKEEYDRLAPGSWYTHPNGTVGRKKGTPQERMQQHFQQHTQEVTLPNGQKALAQYVENKNGGKWELFHATEPKESPEERAAKQAEHNAEFDARLKETEFQHWDVRRQDHEKERRMLLPKIIAEVEAENPQVPNEQSWGIPGISNKTRPMTAAEKLAEAHKRLDEALPPDLYGNSPEEYKAKRTGKSQASAAPAQAPAAAAAAGGAAPMPGEPPLGPDEYRAPDGSHRKKRK